MSAQIAAYGRLGRDPEVLQTKKGNDMTKASIAVLVGRGPQDKPMWLDILAFGEAGEKLALCRKSDGVTVFGKLQGQEYKGKMSYTCMVDTIMTAHQARGPGGPDDDMRPPFDPARAAPVTDHFQDKRASAPRGQPPPPPPDDLDDLSDDIPFRTRLGDTIRDVLGAWRGHEGMLGRWVRATRSFAGVLLDLLRPDVPVRGTQAGAAGNAPTAQAG